MRLTAIHNIFIVCSLTLCALFGSCVQEEDSLKGSENPAKSLLLLRVGTVGGLRDITSALPDREKMHSLRIVILGEGDRVEKNIYIPFPNGIEEYLYRSVEVTPGLKKVFLFANEESAPVVKNRSGETHSLGFFLNKYQVNAGGFEDEVNSLYFSPDFEDEKPLVMSSYYEIVAPSQGVVEKDLLVVRNATKFTVRLKNMRSKAVTVNNITVSGIADRVFVMPHKQNSVMAFAESDGGTSSLYWIDWLQRVAEESQLNPEDMELADRRGWIADYDMPSGVVHGERVYAGGDVRVEALNYDTGIPVPGRAVYPAFYFSESKNLISASEAYGEQSYSIKVTLTDHRDNSVRKLSCVLPNLKALFRSTHVLIDVSFFRDKEIVVDVIPYTEVLLEPEFGL